MRRTISLVITALALMSLIRPAPAETYRNAEYGFAVELPAGAPLCERPIGEPDQGVTVFLDAGVDSCARVGGRPFVGLFGRYNAAFLPSPEAEMRRACALVPGKLMPAPPDLAIGDLPSAACRVNRLDGWIDVVVVAQAGERPAALGATPSVQQATPFINYTALLHTHVRRLDEDMAALRLLLARVRISK